MILIKLQTEKVNKMKKKIKLKDIEDFENIRENIGERFKDWREGLYILVWWLGLLTIVVAGIIIFN